MAWKKESQAPLKGAERIAQGAMDLSCNTENSEKLPKEVVASPSIHLDKALSNLIWLSLLGAGTCLD